MCGQRAMWSARGFVTCLTNCITESAPHGDWFYRALQVPQKVFRIKTQSVYLIDHLTVLPSPFFYLSLPHIYLKIGHTVTALLIWRIDKNLNYLLQNISNPPTSSKSHGPGKSFYCRLLCLYGTMTIVLRKHINDSTLFDITLYLLTMIVHFKIS